MNLQPFSAPGVTQLHPKSNLGCAKGTRLPHSAFHLCRPPGRTGGKTKMTPKPVSWQQTGNPGEAFGVAVIAPPDINIEKRSHERW